MTQLTGITLFSGIGGAACGMQMKGIKIIASVELDIKNRKYSEDCQKMSSINFPNSSFYLSEVGEVADKLPPCDILQASPVCANFSIAAMLRDKKAAVESKQDIQMAKDTCRAIARCSPKHFFLEQVSAYQDSISAGIIAKHLKSNGYNVLADVVDLADYGIPQNRKRYFMLASRDRYWGFPPPLPRMGWKEAIAGIGLEPETTLTKKQSDFIRLNLYKIAETCDLEQGILIDRYGMNTCARRHDQPCWTITRSHFTDGRGGNRKAIINVIDQHGLWNLPIRAIARLCGFPDSFQLGQCSGQGLGYAVPPYFVRHLLSKIV